MNSRNQGRAEQPRTMVDWKKIKADFVAHFNSVGSTWEQPERE